MEGWSVEQESEWRPRDSEISTGQKRVDHGERVKEREQYTEVPF